MRWNLTDLLLLLNLLVWNYCCGYDWNDLNLPDGHIPYFFTNNPDVKLLCEKDETCPYKWALFEKKCWGYEEECPLKQRMSSPECPDPSRGWTKTKEEQLDNFWKGADFGYIQERQKEMTVICAPKSKDDSSLKCSQHKRYCRAKNIYIDFRNSSFAVDNSAFMENWLLEGAIGGHCKLDKGALLADNSHKSALQSWYAEMEHYTSLPFQPINKQHCDIIFDKPTIFMKMDAGVNMFHHFCDFLNLYAAQHLNNTFSTDVSIINWITRHQGYGDLFSETFNAFTRHPIRMLYEFRDKRICIRDAVFPLLPRMRYGMFYNMPLIPGCQGSSLFRAFSEHLVHRLHIPQHGPLSSKIRITVLDRKSQYRNIMNQNELISALKTVGEYDVRLVTYKYRVMPYLDQVEISHNSDIFIGMHGAGLTHMLFQPHWGAVIELFHCGDPNCYLDLARLRGLKYYTWENLDKLTQEDEGHHPSLGAHQKFTNYAFEVNEFMRLVAKAANHVKTHPDYIAANQKLDNNSNIKDEL